MADGRTAPKYHSWSRPVVIEREATHRAIALAELVDQPIQIFHVSSAEVAAEVASAQARGLKVWGETCPQYFVLSASDLDRPGFEGAKFMFSPPARDAEGKRHCGTRCAEARLMWSAQTTSIFATGPPGASARMAITRTSAISRTACLALAPACR